MDINIKKLVEEGIFLFTLLGYVWYDVSNVVGVGLYTLATILTLCQIVVWHNPLHYEVINEIGED